MFPQYYQKKGNKGNYVSDSESDLSDNEIIDCEVMSLRDSDDGEPDNNDDFDYAKFYTEMYEKQFGKFNEEKVNNNDYDGFEFDNDYIPTFSLFENENEKSDSKNENKKNNNIKDIYRDWKDSAQKTTTILFNDYPYVNSTSKLWKPIIGKLEPNTLNDFDIDNFMDNDMTNIISNLSIDEDNKPPQFLPQIELGKKEHFYHSIYRYIILNQQKFHSLFQESIQEIFPGTFNPIISKVNNDLYEKYIFNILQQEKNKKIKTEAILFRCLSQTIMHIQDISFIYQSVLNDNNLDMDWIEQNNNTGKLHILVENDMLFVLLSKIAVCIYYLNINDLYPTKVNILQITFQLAKIN